MHGYIRRVYEMFLGEHEGNMPLESPRWRWEDDSGTGHVACMMTRDLCIQCCSENLKATGHLGDLVVEERMITNMNIQHAWWTRPLYKMLHDNKTDVKETVCEDVDWVKLAQDKVQWCALRFSYIGGEFLYMSFPQLISEDCAVLYLVRLAVA